jgi:hypothetical protein
VLVLKLQFASGGGRCRAESFFAEAIRVSDVERQRAIPKYGFGMAPISARMQGRYDLASEVVLAYFQEGKAAIEVDPDCLSEVKGMFNRCVRQDQWDWFSVFTQFGEMNRRDLHRIGPLLYELRAAVLSDDELRQGELRKLLVAANLPKYLTTFLAGGPGHSPDGVAGWVYILSTREQPKVLKIGMTTRSIFQRVKEINSATGVVYPYSARAVFRVASAAVAESAVFELLRPYRIRPDREFFQVDYQQAAFQIGHLLSAFRRRAEPSAEAAREGM